MTSLLPHTISKTAMVLAAGYGTRMRPLTLTKPKPLFEVGGTTMLDHAIHKLRDAGVDRIVVNCFYLADQIEAHLKSCHDVEIILSRETELLDTGGGIKNALSHFGDQPFFVLNADLPWRDGSLPSLPLMAKTWDAERMDALLLLMPTIKARGFGTRGDFMMDADGRVHRHDRAPPYPFVWISAQIVKPSFFAAYPEKIFSNNSVWDHAESLHRLQGLEHSGTCYHVGTPEDLDKANALLASGQGWI